MGTLSIHEVCIYLWMEINKGSYFKKIINQ